MPMLAIRPVEPQDSRDELCEPALALTGDLAIHTNALRYVSANATGTPDPGDFQRNAMLRACGGRIRPEGRLLAPNGTVTMATKYDGNLADSFDWQDETALTLASKSLDTLMVHEVSASDNSRRKSARRNSFSCALFCMANRRITASICCSTI